VHAFNLQGNSTRYLLGTEAFYMSDQSLYRATTRSACTCGGMFQIDVGQTHTGHSPKAAWQISD